MCLICIPLLQRRCPNSIPGARVNPRSQKSCNIPSNDFYTAFLISLRVSYSYGRMSQVDIPGLSVKQGYLGEIHSWSLSNNLFHVASKDYGIKIKPTIFDQRQVDILWLRVNRGICIGENSLLLLFNNLYCIQGNTYNVRHTHMC